LLLERAVLAAPADVVVQASRGDTVAFERLVAAQSERAFRISRAMLGNDSGASDATQDAFLTAWRELPRLRDPLRFERPGSAASSLTPAVAGCSISEVRRRRSRGTLAIDVVEQSGGAHLESLSSIVNSFSFAG